MTQHTERLRQLQAKFDELEKLVRARLEPRVTAKASSSPTEERTQAAGLLSFWNRLFGGR